MKAEIQPGSDDELVISMDAAEIQALASRPVTDEGLRAGLAGVASGLAESILSMLEHPPEHGGPRQVSCATLRVTRSVVIAEVTLPVGDREVWT